jgi:hypothetical protein
MISSKIFRFLHLNIRKVSKFYFIIFFFSKIMQGFQNDKGYHNVDKDLLYFKQNDN